MKTDLTQGAATAVTLMLLVGAPASAAFVPGAVDPPSTEPWFFIRSTDASSGTTVVTDPEGDLAREDSAAADVLRLGAASTHRALVLYVGLDGSEVKRPITYDVEFVVDKIPYTAHVKAESGGGLTDAHVNGAPADVAWRGRELVFTLAWEDVGDPRHNTTIMEMDVTTRQAASHHVLDDTAQGTFVVTRNRAPVLDPPGDHAVDENASLAFTLTASDADGDALRFGAEPLPDGAHLDAATGEFSWTPTFEAAGTYAVTFTVTDGNATDRANATLTVRDVNRAPVLDAVANRTVAEGEALAFNVTATDADGDTLAFGARDLPRGATLDAATGAFAWTPDHEQAGAYAVTFTVTDGNATDETAATLEVTDVNRAPVLDPVGDRTVEENATLAFTVSAADPDGDAVTLAASGVPANASFDAATGHFSWAPDFQDAGAYPVTFTATDGALEDAEAITITVTNVNRAPVIDPVPDHVIAEGEAVSFTVTAGDADGDALTFGGTFPDGATIDAATGAFAWTPDQQQAGTYTLTFTATDGEATASTSATFDVTAVNVAPVLDPVGDRTGAEGELLAFDLVAGDPDGDALAFSADGLPAGAELDAATGAFRWTPGYDQAGDHVVTFRVHDGALADEETVTLHVAHVNRAPVLDAPARANVTEGDTLAFTVTATDPDGDAVTLAATGLPEGATFDAATGRFEWSPDYDAAGRHEVTFTASDGANATDALAVVAVSDLRPDVHIVRDGDALRETSPGERVTLAFTITNRAPGTDVVTVALSPRAGWTVHDAPTPFALDAGESRTVTFVVSGNASSFEARVFADVTTGAGGVASTYVTLRIPLFVDVLMDKAQVETNETVTGNVSVRYANGAPAANVTVFVREHWIVGWPRSTTLTTGTDGTAAFAFDVSVTGANTPGKHTVRAEVRGAPEGGTNGIATYHVVYHHDGHVIVLPVHFT